MADLVHETSESSAARTNLEVGSPETQLRVEISVGAAKPHVAILDAVAREIANTPRVVLERICQSQSDIGVSAARFGDFREFQIDVLAVNREDLARGVLQRRCESLEIVRRFVKGLAGIIVEACTGWKAEGEGTGTRAPYNGMRGVRAV